MISKELSVFSIEVYREKLEQLHLAAEKAEMDFLTFFRNPKLECWYCPCGDKERNTCEGAGDGSCTATFYKFFFAEDVNK